MLRLETVLDPASAPRAAVVGVEATLAVGLVTVEEVAASEEEVERGAAVAALEIGWVVERRRRVCPSFSKLGAGSGAPVCWVEKGFY